MFGLSHLQFYDLQNETNATTDRNIFKLGSNSILGRLMRSSELFYADERGTVNEAAMNLTLNENSTSNGCNSGGSSNNSSRNSPTTPKNVHRNILNNGFSSVSSFNGKTNSGSCISNNSSGSIINGNNGSNGSGHNERCNSNHSPGTQDTHQKSSELGSPVGSTNGNNETDEVNANTTTINTNSLKRLSGITKQGFEMQKKKYLKVISFLNQHNRHLQFELATERGRRAEELSRIIKSLLCFEAKLKYDKKVINQKLYDKDSEISRLKTLNRVLRKKYMAVADLSGDDNINGDSMQGLNENDFSVQNCPNCRKEYYDLAGKDVWTQTFTDGRSSIEDHTENGSSSDETVSSSFYGARRSVRYTSKRNFREYMRSRCMAIDDPSLDNSDENISALICNGADDNSSPIYEKTNAFSQQMERLHGVRRIESFTDEAELDSENDSTRTMNRRRTAGSNVKLKSALVNGVNGDYESDEMFMPVKTRSYRPKKFAEISPKQQFEASTDDWYASASDLDDSENLRVKPYGYNAVNPVLECVNQILLQQSMDECVMDGPPSLESSENNSGSSGGGSSQQEGRSTSRKRVHFSIKNSMVHVPRGNEVPRITSSPMKSVIDSHDQKDFNLNYESIYSNEYERIGSDHNSSNLYVDMDSKFGQEDRMMTATPLSDKPPKKPPALPPKPANLIKFKRVLKITPHCPTSSIKEDTVDIIQNERETDSGDAEEPDYCSISEVNEAITSVQIVADVHKSADDDLSSQNSEAALSHKTDDVEEIFADVPKLPNVAAIMVPKSSMKNSVGESYMPREMNGNQPSKNIQIPNILAEINKKMSVNGASPNLATPPTTPSKSVSFAAVLQSSSSPSKAFPTMKVASAPINVPTPEPDKLPLQAEFDWYNLDAEYGKSNQPDVIKETDNNKGNLEYHQMMMVTVNEENEEIEAETGEDAMNLNGNGMLDVSQQSIEYKLDEEFSLTNQPDIIKENSFETTTPTTTATTTPSTPRTKNSKAKTVCNGFPLIVDDSPCNNERSASGGGGGGVDRRVKVNRKNFRNFMDSSGLSAKPLPRQRKIYFSGPFV